MAVRLGQGLNIGGMMSGNAAAADLLVEAGRAKGAGLAAIGQGLGQGLATFGANRRADKIRAEENAFRQQSREDMLAERAADNARQDRQVGMHDKEWRATVLVNLAKQYNAEADALEQAAAASGEASLMMKAKAKRGDAGRYMTALEALVSGKGDGTPDMPAPERTQPIGMYDSRVYTPPNAPVTGGGGSMDGAVTRIVDDAFSGGPGFFGPKGSYPAPEPVAPKAKPEASEAAFGVKYTGSPAADIKLANLVLRNVTALRQSGKWGLLSPELQNVYARAEIDANVKSGESQFGLKKQEMAFQNQMQAEDEARKAAADTRSLADLQADVKSLGGPEFKSAEAAKSWLIQNRQSTNREDVQKHQMDMKRLGHEQAMVRQDKAKANRIEIDAVAAANRVDSSPQFKAAKDVAIRLEELAESKRRDFVWASENAKPEVATAARTAYYRALADYETQVRKMATFATQDSAKADPVVEVEFPSWITEDFKERWRAMPQSERDKAIKARGK